MHVIWLGDIPCRVPSPCSYPVPCQNWKKPLWNRSSYKRQWLYLSSSTLLITGFLYLTSFGTLASASSNALLVKFEHPVKSRISNFEHPSNKDVRPWSESFECLSSKCFKFGMRLASMTTSTSAFAGDDVREYSGGSILFLAGSYPPVNLFFFKLVK